MVAVLTVAAMVSTFVYLIARTFLFLLGDYRWYEKVLGTILLLAEIFILVHSLGYSLNIFRVATHKRSSRAFDSEVADLNSYPPVAILVASYKEPLEVVRDTLTCFYNLTYPNKQLFFLDDTRYDLPGSDPEAMRAYRESVDELCRYMEVNLFRRRWRGAKAGIVNDFLDFIRGNLREGFEFTSYDGKEGRERPKYLIVFDADMNPFPDFVEPLVARMEQNPKLAFIQTPQYYSNFEKNRVARASGLQQAIFYEYICEGKSLEDAMFCCGTNVIFRTEALLDVGGFDESSVTEDFATSLKFHVKGWSSAYLNKVCAFGMGPEDLGGYFKQQFRWALGTVGLFRNIALRFFQAPRLLPMAKWWEYFLSGSHYFVGWVFLVMATCPALYLLFRIPSFFARPELYFLFFLPYFVLSLTVFLWTLHQRSYRLRDLLVGVLLNAVSFPVYLKASTLAMLGVRGTFGITPKGGSTSLPLRALWPQVGLALVNFAAWIWGIQRLYYERDPAAGLAMNCFWCFYHCLILSTVLFFNHPEETD